MRFWVALLLSLPAAAQQPGPGCVKIGETATHIQYGCIGEKLPSISPGFFVTDEERSTLKAQSEALKLKRKGYEDQLARLNSLRDQQALNARDLDGLTQQLILDAAVHSLTIVEESLKALAGAGHIPAASRQSILATLTVTKAAFQAVSSASTKDRTQRWNKAVNAVFTLKNLIELNQGLMSTEEQAAFKRGLDTIPKMMSISERYVNGKGTVAELLMSLDDAIDAAAQFVAPLKMARAAGHIIDGEVAMWMIRRDRGAVEEAFVQSQTARRYYQQRLEDVDVLLKFYDERMLRAKQP